VKILTATTLSNPNDVSGEELRYINIMLHATKQTVKAIYVNPLTLNQTEQKPNIKKGTEVLCLFDGLSNFYVLGSTQQTYVSLEEDKIYIVENEKKVEVRTSDLFLVNDKNGDKVKNVNVKTVNTTLETDKLNITNGSDDIVSLISEFIDTVSNGTWIGNLSAPVPTSDATKAQLSNIKARLEAFK
jgi:hypothetical protein